MKIIRTHLERPDTVSHMEREWVYNGLDCCLTSEILDALLPQLDNHTQETYNFSRELQGPVLEMRLRGCLVDKVRRAEVVDELFDKLDVLEHNLERIVLDGLGVTGFNWASNADCQHLFYGVLKVPPITKGGRPTVDRNALEKLEAYMTVRVIARHIMDMRDIKKKIDVLKQEIDADGRIRTSYNIAGTSTGRFSSSISEFGTGGNLQNVEESLRSIFIADPGYKFAKFDAKSGESYIVGALEWNLFKNGKYLDAVESGDVHTAVAKICWPELPWTGNIKHDKDIAGQPYYRHYTYRFMCKKLGHGSNYGGKAQTLATQSRLPLQVVTDFQPKYFGAFPGHIAWQTWTDETLRKTGMLISLTGRKRQFWGRRSDPDILREAIAYDPQCSLADIVNRAMLRIWRERPAVLMFQDHDALTVQYLEDQEDEVIPKIQALLTETIHLKHGRTLTIPYDCKTGWNKGDYDPKKNPDGLKDFHGHDNRKRTPQVHLLDRKRG